MAEIPLNNNVGSSPLTPGLHGQAGNKPAGKGVSGAGRTVTHYRGNRRIVQAKAQNLPRKRLAKRRISLQNLQPKVRIQTEARGVDPEFMAGKVKPAPRLSDVERGLTLGKGAFGEVYLATNKAQPGEARETPDKLQKNYVVKEQTLSGSRRAVEGKAQRAKREVDLQYRADGAIPVTEQALSSDMREHKAMMEHGGVELNSVLYKGRAEVGKPLPVTLRRDLARQMLSQLASIHEQRIIHRDIKPENILVNNQGKAALADFGLARQANRPNVLFTGEAGTPGYMAPEVFSGQAYSFKADVFSAGMVLAEMVTGIKPPLPDYHEQYFAFNHKKHNDYVTSVMNHQGLDPEEKSLIWGMLHPDSNQRLSSGQAARHGFFSTDKPLRELSYPELQTRHQQQFKALARAEQQLSDYQPRSGADSMTKTLMYKIARFGHEVKSLQKELRLKEMESQIRSLSARLKELENEQRLLFGKRSSSKSRIKQAQSLEAQRKSVTDNIASLNSDYDRLCLEHSEPSPLPPNGYG